MRIDRYQLPVEPAPRGPAQHPTWALAFRPFFLGAALLAALWLPLWILVYFGAASPPLGLPPIDWHLHELIFGFAGAVLVGFLLTAARNWSQRPTLNGLPLIGLFALWALGRVALLIGAGWPGWLVAGLGLAYLPLAALALALPLVATQNRRNYAFVGLLLVLTAVGFALHLAPPTRRLFSAASVDILVLFLVVMGGRVIPFFTRNALRDVAHRVRSHRALDWACALSVIALTIADLAGKQTATDRIALLAGALNLARLALWSPWLTARHPILWILHLGYAWLGLGLVLMGLSPFVPGLAGSAPLHAITVGALGTLTLGMMARVSLGHTGRPLTAGRPIVLAFGLMTAAALVRVALPLASPSLYPEAIQASGVLFALAWLLFVLVFWPMLTRPRPDGAPG